MKQEIKDLATKLAGNCVPNSNNSIPNKTFEFHSVWDKDEYAAILIDNRKEYNAELVALSFFSTNEKWLASKYEAFYHDMAGERYLIIHVHDFEKNLTRAFQLYAKIKLGFDRSIKCKNKLFICPGLATKL